MQGLIQAPREFSPPVKSRRPKKITPSLHPVTGRDRQNASAVAGYGALAGHAAATVARWDIGHSRAALGDEATWAWLQAKLEQANGFNPSAVRDTRAALAQGQGQTCSGIVMDIFSGHPQITQLPA